MGLAIILTVGYLIGFFITFIILCLGVRYDNKNDRLDFLKVFQFSVFWFILMPIAIVWLIFRGITNVIKDCLEKLYNKITQND